MAGVEGVIEYVAGVDFRGGYSGFQAGGGGVAGERGAFGGGQGCGDGDVREVVTGAFVAAV